VFAGLFGLGGAHQVQVPSKVVAECWLHTRDRNHAAREYGVSRISPTPFW
jgi:hypothetical protein